MKNALVCRLAFVDDDRPYIVPVNFVSCESHLYFHSAKSGKKIDILRKNNKVCFEMELDIEIIKGEEPCVWGMKYLSVIGIGRASFIEDSEEKKKVLDLLMEKYDGAGLFSYDEKILEKVLVIDVKIEELSGKKSHIR